MFTFLAPVSLFSQHFCMRAIQNIHHRKPEWWLSTRAVIIYLVFLTMNEYHVFGFENFHILFYIVTQKYILDPEMYSCYLDSFSKKNYWWNSLFMKFCLHATPSQRFNWNQTKLFKSKLGVIYKMQGTWSCVVGVWNKALFICAILKK